MLQRSALRNIPLLLQLAYGAAKNPLELWQDAAEWVSNFFVQAPG
jgi:hypothetical protein